MRPQDVVAIILAVGVTLMLLSGSNFKFLLLEPSQLQMAQDSYNEQALDFWQDILNVLLGALAGYIAARR